MKQGDKFLKTVGVVLAALAVLYVVIAVLSRPDEGYTLYTSVYYEVGDGISTSGFVVRDETVLTSTKSLITLTRSEGERVAKGDTVANCYDDTAAQSRQLQVDNLEEELAQLNYAYSFSASDAEAADIDAEIVTSITEITNYVNRRQLTPANTLSTDLKALILRRYVTGDDTTTLWERISAVKNELNSLYAQSGKETSQLKTDEAGYFSGTVDGYETILTPDFLQSATVKQVLALPDEAKPTNETQIGKLIRTPQWYLITAVETASLTDCSKGDTLTVHFAHDFYNDVRMTISRIGEDEDGMTVLVLTTDDYIQDAAALREQAVELLFDKITGLRVPKKAIYVNDDGQSGVYVLEGAEAKWKTVIILYDGGSTYIVKMDKESTDNLWPEDEIILTDQEIFSGKVMGQ